MNEQVYLLGRSQPVIGVVTTPEASDPNRPAFILSNSGAVHRVGPSRLYVRVARRLAELGFVVVRIDHRGIGDSDLRRDSMPFYAGAHEEIREVMDELEERHGIRRFAIMGICSGAENSFAMARADERVVGAVLINGGGMGSHPDLLHYLQHRAIVRRYWRESIYRPDRWLRALTGRVQYRVLLDVFARRMQRIFGRSNGIDEHARSTADEFQTLVDRGVQLLLVHSGNDDSLVQRDVVLADRRDVLEATGRFREATVLGADHTFTLLWSQRELLEILAPWAEHSWCKARTGAAGGVE